MTEHCAPGKSGLRTLSNQTNAIDRVCQLIWLAKKSKPGCAVRRERRLRQNLHAKALDDGEDAHHSVSADVGMPGSSSPPKRKSKSALKANLGQYLTLCGFALLSGSRSLWDPKLGRFIHIGKDPGSRGIMFRRPGANASGRRFRLSHRAG